MTGKFNWNYHSHSNYTDGENSIEEIAGYCDEKGIAEIAITEHVRRVVSYDFNRLLAEMNRCSKRFNVRIISGVEAKILPDGSLDCPEQIKEKVEIVIGSVHSLNGMDETEAHERLAESDCMIFGHPQMFNDKIVASLVRTGKVVELSNRYHQSVEMIRAFRDAGLMFSIGLDSHRLEEIDRFGSVGDLVDRLDLWNRLWRFQPRAHPR